MMQALWKTAIMVVGMLIINEAANRSSWGLAIVGAALFLIPYLLWGSQRRRRSSGSSDDHFDDIERKVDPAYKDIEPGNIHND